MTAARHPQRILVATTNPGKFREIVAIFGPLPVQLLGLDELGQPPPVVEDGATFAANAAKKALHYAAWSKLWTLAEDSGLEVDALDRAPGVYSARYAGPDSTDAANNAKLVAALAGVPDHQRSARFRCAAVLAAPDGILARAEGTIAGRIIDQPRGRNGFGYDPHFFVPELGCTTAELSPHDKNRLSHRGQALRALLPHIQKLLQTPQAT